MKRVKINNKSEFVDWVNSFNGKMNCYTSVYDFAKYAEDAAIDSTCIKDRMFLDFDAHGEPLEKAYNDCVAVCDFLLEQDVLFNMYFSGKGFHMIVYGERTDDIRCIQSYFSTLVPLAPSLDRSGIQVKRLRRIPNTVNLSSEGPYFCIPITVEDLGMGLSLILKKAMTGNHPQVRYGSKLVKWPSVKPIEVSDIEIKAPKPVGELPILPCLNNAIMVENPGHFARVYLTQWYRDILTSRERHISDERKSEVMEIIINEFKAIANKEEVWLDWDEKTTRHHVKFVVDGGYHAPSCKEKLIPQGYCPGKCWRYCE
tara:strand:- start:5575 stop:6516 length:942 start_codon:yes stop_codon:yes gene_type:complete